MDFGNMNVKHRVGKTFTGVSFDVAKSAIQKYIRRGDWEMAARIIVDINQVRIVQEHPDEYVDHMNSQPNHGSDYKATSVISTAKATLTNTKNRLIVIASEDISAANHQAAEQVSVMSKATPDMNTMVRIAVYLARSIKLRLLSDYKTIFLLPPYYWKSDVQQEQHIEIHKQLQILFPFMTPQQIPWRDALHSGQVHSFFYSLGQDMLKSGTDVVLGELKTVLARSKDSVIKALLTTYGKMTHAEKPLYLYQAALIMMGHGDMKQDIDIVTLRTSGSKASRTRSNQAKHMR